MNGDRPHQPTLSISALWRAPLHERHRPTECGRPTPWRRLATGAQWWLCCLAVVWLPAAARPSAVWAQGAGETPWVDTTGPVPSDAVVIFDGKDTSMLAGPNGGDVPWPVEDGAVTCDPSKQGPQQGLWSKLHFRDAQIHAEFAVPKENKRGESSGNSGLYLHGLFEQQILNSYRNPSRPKGMVGALYGFSAPLVNAARAPGEWQSYDIIFKAPRRNDSGEPVAAGSVTTLLNGVVVQLNTEFTKRKSVYTPLYYNTTDYAVRIRKSVLKTGCGPFQLQNHGSKVKFRNLWIRPLDDKAFIFEKDGPPAGRSSSDGGDKSAATPPR